MKTIFKTIAGAAALLIAAMPMTSCHEDHEALRGEGTLMLSTAISSDVKIISRADTEEDLAEKAIMWISNSKGVVRKFQGLNNIPADGIKLMTGHYICEVWTGDSVSADFEKKYYKGRETFDITNNSITKVSVNCKIANTVVAVKYDSKVKELVKDFTMTVGHKRGELVFEGADTRRGYFMMPTYDKDLVYTFEGTLENGSTFTKTGVIENAEPTTLYTIEMNYDSQGGDNPDGGSYFVINVDESTIDFEEEIYITLAPQFEGYEFNLEDGLVGEKGKVGRHSVVCRAVGDIVKFILDGDMLESIIGGRDVDLMNMSNEVGTKLEDAGINMVLTYYEDGDYTILKLNFEEELLNALEEGDYEFMFTATDSYNKTMSAVLKIMITDAPVLVDDVVTTAVWGSHATVTARILKEDAENPGISYRKKGDTDWIPATVSTVSRSSDLTAELTGLTPGTTYQYTATAKDFISKSIHEFTTEAATQFPNSGFENWHTDGYQLPFGTNEEKFWDSGNQGSWTMSKNVTTPSEDKKHGGKYSAKLSSQFVGVGALGKFAAGNIFIGEYLATVGTNGVLGWGRKWTTRPSAVKVWVHYNPVAVTATSNDVPTLKKGDMDSGKIYVAVLDEYTSSYSGKSYPVICKTKEKEFFDKDSEHVIAYGELVLDKATEGDAMVQVTIPLTYKIFDKKASNIMLVAAASQYGDYFAGGDGSVLYLDDFELVY